MNEKPYPSDLTNEEWHYIKDLIPPPKPDGQPRELDMRQVFNAIFYVTKGGIQWRLMPKDFPNQKSVYNYFRAWKIDGVWQTIHDTLRAKVRQKIGRHKHPFDAQTTGGLILLRQTLTAFSKYYALEMVATG